MEVGWGRLKNADDSNIRSPRFSCPGLLPGVDSRMTDCIRYCNELQCGVFVIVLGNCCTMCKPIIIIISSSSNIIIIITFNIFINNLGFMIEVDFLFRKRTPQNSFIPSAIFILGSISFKPPSENYPPKFHELIPKLMGLGNNIYISFQIYGNCGYLKFHGGYPVSITPHDLALFAPLGLNPEALPQFPHVST